MVKRVAISDDLYDAIQNFKKQQQQLTNRWTPLINMKDIEIVKKKKKTSNFFKI